MQHISFPQSPLMFAGFKERFWFFAILESERMEDLQCNGLKIIQDKNLYAFTSDSVEK